MSKFLNSRTIRDASERLINSKAKSGFVDFLVLKRALQRAKENEISFSSRDQNFTGAMKDLAETFPPITKTSQPDRFEPFVKVFGTAGANKYVSRKWTTNGPADTLSGPKWSPVIQIEGASPRRGSLKADHVSFLPSLILKLNGELPSLEDSAVWYYRATDVDERFGEVTDSQNLRQQLCDGFIADLGLLDKELSIIFDQNVVLMAEREIHNVLQASVADPMSYLPDLENTSETGKLVDLVPSFLKLAGKEDVGLRVTDELFRRFAAALGSKRFLILTGLAGSGKTKLAQAFARWLTPAAGEGESDAHLLIPVGADWTGSDAILGYPDGLDSTRYVTRPALELIQRAAEREDEKIPHFLILDEMNLSHVERYFADLLSMIESGASNELYKRGTPDKEWDGLRSGVEPTLRLPSNLFIIGTVNVDETTYMFSPKVLDRANVIEFRIERDDLIKFLAAPRTPDLEPFSRAESSFGAAFVTESEREVRIPNGVKEPYAAECLLFFDLLGAHNAEFGYRVANEAARFMHFYRVLSCKEEDADNWFNSAMDAVIVQKLLPKLHGSRTKLEGLLWALAYACGAERGGMKPEDFLEECVKAGKAEDEKNYSPEAVAKLIEGKKIVDENTTARYPLSFEKILRMYRKLIRDQFVTFAEA